MSGLSMALFHFQTRRHMIKDLTPVFILYEILKDNSARNEFHMK